MVVIAVGVLTLVEGLARVEVSGKLLSSLLRILGGRWGFLR